jgi:Carboxylesterase family
LIATWTSDDGSLAVDAKTNNDAEVVDSFASEIVHFSEDIGEKILSLYPVSDFENQASAYQGVSPEYFRASRIVRDIDPVCPLLTIVQQVSKYSTKDLYVGELNETRLLPYWEAWGLPWGVSHLSDIPYFFNEALPSPGDNSPDAFALSANYSGSFISFANTGNPVKEGKETFQHWPKANTDGSFGMAALVIGGLHGTGPAATAPQRFEEAKQKFSEDDLLETSRGELRKRTFRHDPPSPRADALEQEKLVERCKYLSSLRIV